MSREKGKDKEWKNNYSKKMANLAQSSKLEEINDDSSIYYISERASIALSEQALIALTSSY